MAAPALLNGAMVRSDRKRSAGYSLIEVLTATALIAIVYAIAVPRFGQLRGPYAARSGASQVAGVFQAARMRAIATNSNIRLTYNSSNGTYTVDRQSGVGWTTEVRNQLPTGVTLSSFATNPQFSRTGLLNGDYTITVSAYGKTRTVTVNVLGKTTIS
jgi:prepilin-type N-terminal cleavage/methylation domain-containing protein